MKEILLSDIINALLKNKRQVLITTTLFVFMGILVAIFSEVEYESKASFLSAGESRGGTTGSLGNLAALAGVNLGSMSNSEQLSPFHYSLIFESKPFLNEIVEKEITFSNGMKVHLTDYYSNIYTPSIFGLLKQYTIGLPSKLKSLLKSGKDNTKNSKDYERERAITKLKKQISFNLNEKIGDMKITASLPDPVAAKSLCEHLVKSLETRITELKIQKALNEFEFVSERLEDAKSRFNKIQNELAQFKDRNNNISSATAQVQLQSLQSEYDVAFSVYSQLSGQLETARLKISEDTPVLTIIDPAEIPLLKSKPQRAKIVVAFFAIGLVLSAGLIFIRTFVLLS
ncbi:MAG: hypothetical protein JJ978_19355 [Roseivirga sp.]|jgi:uncharacterized protein involved in exopolysaccharide biosynthesis|uniref:GNVR domain-containing protein n=1 Tax=Roseivirga sp. TaxID=1964215 RepID=UPI001B1B58EB|nr:GNVR domain-containing protein [Roseivirga sp.]MBO6497732.1 hypothetical protein [Roseivirga sp.]